MGIELFNNARENSQPEFTVNILLPAPTSQFLGFTNGGIQCLSRVRINRIHDPALQSRLGTKLAGTQYHIPAGCGQ